MTYSSYSVKVPGKLMIAGEYAVLELNEKAIVMAVDRYVTAYIESSDKNVISIPQKGLEDIAWEINNDEVKFNISDSRLKFIQNSISVVNQYLREKLVMLQPFKLKIKSELEDSLTGKKYGLGSSAAIVVAVISAILHFHGFTNESSYLDEIFKLSTIAHLKTQKNGSGADIAAAVYGGWIEYSTFNSQWILNELEKGKKVSELIYTHWTNLLIKPLSPPSSLQFAVGWTKEPSSTAPMIRKIQNFRDEDLKSYKEFLNESFISVEGLIQSFKNNDCAKAINSLIQSRRALQKFDKNAGINIETYRLKTLCSIAEKFGSGKSSGAGGGDCGIAFLKSDAEIQELYREWKAADINPLNLRVSKKGVSIR